VPRQRVFASLAGPMGTPEKVIWAVKVLAPACWQVKLTGTVTAAPAATGPGKGILAASGPDCRARWGNHCAVQFSVPVLRTVIVPVRGFASAPSMP
jgi:hypothetical protein